MAHSRMELYQLMRSLHWNSFDLSINVFLRSKSQLFHIDFVFLFNDLFNLQILFGHLAYELKFILQVTEEIEGTRFNTGISAMMEFLNVAYKVSFFIVLIFNISTSQLFSWISIYLFIYSFIPFLCSCGGRGVLRLGILGLVF